MLLHEISPIQEQQMTEGWKQTAANFGMAGAIAAAGVGSAHLQGKLPGNGVAQSDKQVVQQVNVKRELPTLQKELPAKKTTSSKSKPVKLVTGSRNEEILRKAATAAGIQGVELAAFLAQMAHESANFSDMVENNPDIEKYSTGRTAKILGNKNENDAKRFIGRGFIQLTGRWNYEWMEKNLGIDLTSSWSAAHKAADPKIAAKIAVEYWKRRVKPQVDDFSDVHQVTKPINSNLNGIKDRINKFDTFSVAMGIADNNQG